MHTTTRSGLAVVAAAVVTALVGWAVIRLLGVDLTLKADAGMSQVGAVDVLLASLVAGLAAWGVYTVTAPEDLGSLDAYEASLALEEEERMAELR